MEAEAYLDMAAEEGRHWWFRGRRRILDSVIRRVDLPANARILELGSGTGGNLAMLAQFGRVTAVEMNETARAISKARGIIQDIRAGCLPDEAPLGGEMFDLIGLFDVLEHIEEDDAALGVIRRHLAPGGSFIVMVPAYAWMWSAHDEAAHHKRRYAKAQLQAKLRAAGFVITRLSYLNTLLFPLAVVVRLASRLLNQSKASGNTTPPFIVNEVFARVFGVESRLLAWADLPFGLSLLAIARHGAGPDRN
jgi:SAM-dependent methyltransferase